MKKLLVVLVLILACADGAFSMKPKADEVISMEFSRRKLKRWARHNNYAYVIVNDIKDFSVKGIEGVIYELTRNLNLDGKQLNLLPNSYIKFNGYLITGGKITGILKNDILHAESLGAIPDDAIDDAEPIQNILNIAQGRVEFNDGTYTLSRFVEINSDNLDIDGKGCTLLFAPNIELSPAIRVISQNNILLQNFNIISQNKYDPANPFPRKVNTKWSNIIAIAVSNVNNFTIRNVYFEDVETAVKIDGGQGMSQNVTLSDLHTSATVAMPVYMSHVSNVLMSRCRLEASIDASEYDHHIYGSSFVQNHNITKCEFIGGSGIPIHYYSTDSTMADNININDCLFNDTLGSVINASGTCGSMEFKNSRVESLRSFEQQGVFAAMGDNVLEVKGIYVYTPFQFLFSATNKAQVSIEDIDASVKGLQCSLPSKNGCVTLANNTIRILDGLSVLYLSDSISKTVGNILIISNSFVLNPQMYSLFSVRGTINSNLLIEDNTFMCRERSRFFFDNKGFSNPHITVTGNKVIGCNSNFPYYDDCMINFSNNIIE